MTRIIRRAALLGIAFVLSGLNFVFAHDSRVELDNAKAIALISASPEIAYGNVKPEHVFTSEPYLDNERVYRYVLIGYALGGNCHVCTLKLVAGVFIRNPNGWSLYSVQPDVADVGAFGAIGGPVDAIKLGEDHPGVAIRVIDSHQGEEETYLTLLAVVGGQVTPVWTGVTGMDDSQTLPCLNAKTKCPDWMSVLDALPGSKDGWFDLRLHTKGRVANSDGAVVGVDEVKTFSFNGSTYMDFTSR